MFIAPARALVTAGLALAALAAAAADPYWAGQKTGSAYPITVYRSATCGCCKAWVSHLRDHHFTVEEVVLRDLGEVKRRYGVAPELASCHTAVAGEQVFEGHVPAQDIKRALEAGDPPRLLSVPGMPSGTPGMDFPGARKDAFDVIAEDRTGGRRVYSRYAGY